MKNGYCFLTDLLPTEIHGVKADTRACTAIAVILKLDEECPMEEKVSYIYGKMFGKAYETVLAIAGCWDRPEEMDKAVIRFLSGADEVKSWAELHADTTKNATDGVSVPSGKTNHGIKDFDFRQDSEAIISAFRQVYGLSLDDTCNLHWWEFLALFRNLPSEGNAFSMIRDIRTKKPKKDDTPEYKATLAKAKRQVALKDTRSPEQKAKDREGMFDNIDL